MITPRLGLRHRAPVTAGTLLTFVITRDLPLSPAEHVVVLDVALRGRRRGWRRVEDLDVAGLDGFGVHRVVMRLCLRSPDLELVDLPRLAELLDELCAAVPAGELWADDPLALFGQREGRVCCEGRWLLPALPEGWREPREARLLGPPGTEPGLPATPPPGTEAELADLLEVVDLGGAGPATLAAGATGALRHLPTLREALFGGARPGAACRVFAALAERGLADREALIEGARAVLGDGDAREREAAQALLDALGAADQRPGTGEAPDWSVVQRLGRALLEAPALGPSRDETTGGGGASDWEDDLDLEAMVLEDRIPGGSGLEGGGVDRHPQEPHDADALLEIVAGLATGPLVRAAELLVSLPSFPARAAGRAGADDSSAAGACLLLALDAWPARRIAGCFSALRGLALGDRPWPVRGLALHALATVGGPDATAVLVDASRLPDADLAGQAVRALGRVPGARARVAVRAAAARADLACAAMASLAEAGDVAGFELAERLLSGQTSPEPASSEPAPPGHRSSGPVSSGPAVAARRAAAAGLDRLGGRRAVPLLEKALAQDDAPSVRRAAVGALARVAPVERVATLLGHPDVDQVTGALLSLAEAGRAELGGQVLRCARHPDPLVRGAAATALGLLGVPAATPALLQLLLDEEVPVGLAALDSLGSAGDSRAVRLLRLLAGHPGPPGRRATEVLQRGRRLRLAPPDARVRVLARADHLLSSRARARMAAAMGGLPLEVHVAERGLVAEGDIPPEDLDTLADLVRAIAHVDEQEPGLHWSIRDGQGLVRRLDGAWRLDATRGELPRDAGWFRGELPHVGRVPLSALELVLPPDPADDEALPVGTGEDELADVDEDAEDDATEQTISAFLEEATSAAPPDGPLAGEAPPPRRAASSASASDEAATASGHEELLFEPDPESVPPRR